MIIKGIQDEDFVNYKKPSMVIAFPYCSFKCDKECGKKVCQNGTLATSNSHEIPISRIVERYKNNHLTSAVVCAGLEPMDSFDDLFDLVKEFRKVMQDDFVIFTGYVKDEIEEYVNKLKQFPNIIIKFGRYIPDQQPHYDDVLGVNLASSNQYAERIS